MLNKAHLKRVIIFSLVSAVLVLSAFIRARADVPHRGSPSVSASGFVDALVFGNTISEEAHHFNGKDTTATVGALEQSARLSLPRNPVDYDGGDLTFDMKVDPIKQNYFTVKFWGSDVNGGQKALLYINGEQLGYRHLGDYEALNHGTDVPPFRNRFFYYTDVLPLALTHGRKSLTLTIRTIGPISGYALGGGYDGYQGRMTAPSRGYYRAYVHTSASPPGLETEAQGAAPTVPPVRSAQDADAVLATYTDRIKGHVRDLMTEQGRMSPGDIRYLAAATRRDWAAAGEDAAGRQQAITQLAAKIDDQSQRLTEPDVYAKGGYQADWGGVFAPIGEAIYWMDKDLTPAQWNTLLAETISVNGQPMTRRAAWTAMLKGNFDYARTHVARISNQAEICMYGAYCSNKGLQIINPAVAEPEETAKRFLFEPAGISPYLGNDILDSSGRLIGREKPYGDHYYQVTEAGLTRENTYVAIYGEWTNDLVNWWHLYGHDEILKKALINANARAQMKYPDYDDEGFRAMRMEGVIESRGPSYPDNIGYGVRANGGHGLDMARCQRWMEETPEKYRGPEWASYRRMASESVGYAQQFLNDNQYLPSLSDGDDFEVPADYAYVKSLPLAGVLLPATNLHWYSPTERAALKAEGLKAEGLKAEGLKAEGLKAEGLKAEGLKNSEVRRSAWADVDDGVVAVRDGDLTLFAGLVMKANWGINGLARIHCVTPTIDRLATVVPDVQFDASGQYTARADQVQVQFMHANEPPEGTHQALAGEALPVASQPNVHETGVQDTPYIGYANFYALHYLHYLIGMNTTRPEYGNARSYDLKLPAGTGSKVYDFISGKDLPVTGGMIKVGPLSTVVLRVSEADGDTPMATRLIEASCTTGGVSVRWEYAAGATGYIVKRAASADGPYTEIGRTSGENAFTDPGVKDSNCRVSCHYEHGVA